MEESLGAKLVAVVVVFGFGLLISWGMYANASGTKAQHAVENMGYTNVRVVKKSFILPFSICGDDDDAVFTVQGTDPRGVLRTLKVCVGVFKGATVRSN